MSGEAPVPVFSNSQPEYYQLFSTFKTMAYVGSTFMTLLLVSGVPLKSQVTNGILSIAMLLSFIFLVLSVNFTIIMMAATRPILTSVVS